jgi:hypothetical protein
MSAIVLSASRPRATGELPQFIRDLIASPPAHGGGVHQWLFKVARQLHAHRDEQSIIDLLTAAVDGCGRHVPHTEIVAAVSDAKSCAWTPGSTSSSEARSPRPKWPKVSASARTAAIQSASMDLASLWEASPIRCVSGEIDAEWIIDELFPGNPLLCVGHASDNFKTAPREALRGHLSEMSLIVPSPMSALKGARKSDGKLSGHTLDNTGPRHYLVTEFDSGSQDEQAALIWRLKGYAPLVAVVHSGGKSLHAWWHCQGVDTAVVHRFFAFAVSLGADPTTWTRSQFVRLPEGWRADKQARQACFYLNTERTQGHE